MNVFFMALPPMPFETSSFPITRPCQTKRTRFDEDGYCPICLDVLGSDKVTTLPCGHKLHYKCCMALVPVYNVLGSLSMQRCPMCRTEISTEDIPAIIGCPTANSVNFLIMAHRRATFTRHVFCSSGYANSENKYAIVKQLNKTRSSDGFVYNTALLCLDRMIQNKIGFCNLLTYMLRTQWEHIADECVFIDTHLAGHVDFLMHTSGQLYM